MATQDNNNQKPKRWQGFNPVFYIVAGAYLCYLAYKLLKELLETGDIKTEWHFAVVGGVFALAGIVVVILGIIRIMQKKKFNEQQAKIQEEEESKGMGYVIDDTAGTGYVIDAPEGLGYAPIEDDEEGLGYAPVEDDEEEFESEEDEDTEE